MLNNAFMRRLTALLLCAVLVLGILVSSAVADETGTLPAQETTGVIETADPAQEEAPAAQAEDGETHTTVPDAEAPASNEQTETEQPAASEQGDGSDTATENNVSGDSAAPDAENEPVPEANDGTPEGDASPTALTDGQDGDGQTAPKGAAAENSDPLPTEGDANTEEPLSTADNANEAGEAANEGEAESLPTEGETPDAAETEATDAETTDANADDAQTPWEATFFPGGATARLSAPAGALQNSEALTVVSISDAALKQAALEAAGLDSADESIRIHCALYAFSGTEFNSAVSVSMENIGFAALRLENPNAQLSARAFLLQQGGSAVALAARFDPSLDSVSFSLSQPATVALVLWAALPTSEDAPVESEAASTEETIEAPASEEAGQTEPEPSTEEGAASTELPADEPEAPASNADVAGEPADEIQTPDPTVVSEDGSAEGETPSDAALTDTDPETADAEAQIPENSSDAETPLEDTVNGDTASGEGEEPTEQPAPADGDTTSDEGADASEEPDPASADPEAVENIDASEEPDPADSIPGDSVSGDAQPEDAQPEETLSEDAQPEIILPSDTRVSAPDAALDNDALFEEYIRRSLPGLYQPARRMLKAAGPTAYAKLSENSKTLYDILVVYVRKVANGQLTSTIFPTIDIAQTLGVTQTPRSAAGWGVKRISYVDEDGNNMIDDDCFAAMQADLDVDTTAIMRALMSECPYDMYWFDKTTGMSSGADFDIRVIDGETCIAIESFTFRFYVAQDYQAGSNTSVDVTLPARVNQAASRISSIIADHASESDYNKLVSYKNEICELVVYNDAAAQGGIPYGDPWQLVYVFDDDASSNVVCEGYSKAFKYLCDQSSFSEGTRCILVTGQMGGGTGAGPHMWNIVYMPDARYYLADITNSDSGSAGQNGGLFLNGYSTHASTSQYTYSGITYTYDSSTLGSFGQDNPWLQLSGSDYVNQRYYAVNISAMTNGTVEADRAKAAEGETVTLTVVPQDNSYKLTTGSLKVTQGSTEIALNESSGVYSFTMPSGEVSVTAQFEKKAQTASISFTADAQSAIVSFTRSGNPVSDFTALERGTYTLEMSAYASVTGIDLDVSEYTSFTFTVLGGEEISVSLLPTETSSAVSYIGPEAVAGFGYTDLSFAVTQLSLGVIETEQGDPFPAESLGVTISSGSFTSADGQSTIPFTVDTASHSAPGAQASVSGATQAGSTLTLSLYISESDWYAAPAGEYSVSLPYTTFYTLYPDGSAQGETSTVTLTLTRDEAFQFTFHSNNGLDETFALEAPVSLDKNGQRIGALLMPDNRFSYPGYTFSHWSITAVGDPGYVMLPGIHTLTVNGDFDLYAIWTRKAYAVAIEDSENGTITASAPYADAGETVTLTVTADPGYELESVSASSASGNVSLTLQVDGTYVFTMPEGDVTVSAVFSEPVIAQPQFTDHSIVLSGSIGLDFYLALPGSVSDYQNATVRLTGSKIDVSLPLSDGVLQSDGSYKFTCFISSIQMAETITPSFTYTLDGQSATVTGKGYSVKQYISAFVDQYGNDATQTRLVTIARALADYGHYAQPYLSRVNSWTVGSDYAEMSDSYTSSYSYDSVKAQAAGDALSKTLDESKVASASYALKADYETAIYLFLTPAQGATLSSATVDGQAATLEQVGSRYRIVISGIKASALAHKYTVVVDGTTTITLSALSYVNTVLNSTQEASQQADIRNFVSALYMYAASFN